MIPTIAASRVYNGSLFASYLRGNDPRLHGIIEFIASEWHSTPSKDSWQFGGTPNIGLDSSVGKSAGTSNQRSQVQTPIQSNFLCSSEIDL